MKVSSDLPHHAVLAGRDSDGALIYVARAYHEKDLLVAKYVPGRNQAYVSYSGQEIEKSEIEVLCGEYYKWIPASNGNVPDSAVRGGQTSSGEPLYIGRAKWEGSLIPGKIHPSHQSLYVAYGGKEHKVTNYEVLAQPETFISAKVTNVPSGAIRAGHDEDGSTIYMGRAFHAGDMLPVKVCPNLGKGYVSFDGKEILKYECEILVGNGYDWVASKNGNVPANAVRVGPTSTGEMLYFGRGSHSRSLIPGKVQKSHGCLYVPFGGQEIKMRDYEVLVRV